MQTDVLGLVFSVGRHELAPGVVIDVYNLHADAGGGAGDEAARAAQFVQLAAFMSGYSAGNAVIVAGDTNLKDSRGVLMAAFKSALGLGRAQPDPPIPAPASRLPECRPSTLARTGTVPIPSCTPHPTHPQPRLLS